MKKGPFDKDAVEETSEFRRVFGLPREVTSAQETAELVRDLTAALKLERGTWTLKSIQALALNAIGRNKGGFFPIHAGFGKTLISALAPTVLGSKRPALLVPAALRQKTFDEFEMLGNHFLVARNIQVLSYQKIGTVTGARELDRIEPDLIILDEGHRAKNKKAAVTKRIARYMREHPDTIFVVMSGTLMKDSLADFAHLCKWALKEGAPVPGLANEVQEWADALDEKLANPMARRSPGPLLKFATKEDFDKAEGDETRAARRGFRRRMIETPGVVATQDEKVDCELRIRAIEYEVQDVTEENFRVLRSEWLRPDGWALTLAPEVWRVANELTLGLHYRWDPTPSEEWRNARKAWAAFAREILSDSRTIDSELQVKMAIRDGAFPEGKPLLAAWEKLQPTFTINSKPTWHDDTVLDLCAKWMKQRPGIVWTNHSLFGRELSRRTGAAYFGAEGKDRHDRQIDQMVNPVTPESDPKGIIASVQANGTGRNLQAWNRGLITQPPSSALTWEQLLARMQRMGQKAALVEFDVLIGCAEHWNAWLNSIKGAVATEDTMGQVQRLLTADLVGFPDDAEVAERREWRWGKQAGVNAVDDILAGFDTL